jgi:hypothetical protein
MLPFFCLQLQCHLVEVETGELQVGSQLGEFDWTIRITAEADAVYVLSMLQEVQQQAVHLPLPLHACCAEAATCQHSCLVQPAVCPGSAVQGGWVISTVLQHCQQTWVWQFHQGHCRGVCHPATEEQYM